MNPKLKVEDLCFSYDGQPILDGISLQVMPGEFVSLLGTSGCGKSTLLNLLSGVLKPNSGSVQVDGQLVEGITEHFAYMPQNDLLFDWKTILDNVCLYASVHGNYAEAKEEALKSFPGFGLAGCEKLYPVSLSGGMRQRAAFLRTALCRADILLLDEPFGALDVISREDMQDWLLSMRERLSRTAVLVTHDVDEAIFLSNRILVMGGRPARILGEIAIPESHRTRDWLFEQGELRQKIYRCIKSA